MPLESLTVIVSFGCPARMHTPIQFPKVLFTGKARDAAGVVPASTLVCCISLIPPPLPEVTVSVKVWVAAEPTPLLAVIVIE